MLTACVVLPPEVRGAESREGSLFSVASRVEFCGLPVCRVLVTLEHSRLVLWNSVPKLFQVTCGEWVRGVSVVHFLAFSKASFSEHTLLSLAFKQSDGLLLWGEYGGPLQSLCFIFIRLLVPAHPRS